MVKKVTKRGIDYEIDEERIELPPEVDAEASKLITEANDDLAERRVSFRWEREPLDLVRKVAAEMGVPYQTYMKQVIYRQALADWSSIMAARPVNIDEVVQRALLLRERLIP